MNSLRSVQLVQHGKDKEGRLRTIPFARIASAAEGLAEVEIFATLWLSGSWMRTAIISASGQEQPLACYTQAYA